MPLSNVCPKTVSNPKVTVGQLSSHRVSKSWFPISCISWTAKNPSSLSCMPFKTLFSSKHRVCIQLMLKSPSHKKNQFAVRFCFKLFSIIGLIRKPFVSSQSSKASVNSKASVAFFNSFRTKKKRSCTGLTAWTMFQSLTDGKWTNWTTSWSRKTTLSYFRTSFGNWEWSTTAKRTPHSM